MTELAACWQEYDERPDVAQRIQASGAASRRLE